MEMIGRNSVFESHHLVHVVILVFIGESHLTRQDSHVNIVTSK